MLCLLSKRLEKRLEMFVTSFLNRRMLGSCHGLVCMSVGVGVCIWVSDVHLGGWFVCVWVGDVSVHSVLGYAIVGYCM